MRIKVSIIQAKDEFELADKLSKDDKDFFATQPIQKIDGSWVAFCYLDSLQNKNTLPTSIPHGTSLFNKTGGTGSGETIPNERPTSQLPATKQQLFYLNKNNLPFKEGITKTEAFLMIKEHKGK